MILEGILIVIGTLVALFLILAAIMPKKYSISSQIIIHRPQNEVFNFVKLIGNQDKYSKWVMADPNVKIETEGVDGTVGFKSAWASELKNVGVGEQEIIGINNGVGYDAEIRFVKPFEGVSHAHITTEAVSANETKFVTTFSTKTPFPMNVMVPMIKQMLQKDLDENSKNLKNVLEK